MEYPDLLGQIKKLKLTEVRQDSADFFEFVVETKGLEALEAGLKEFFGAVFNPGKQKLPRQAEQCVEEFGGVRDNQTLYYAERNGHSHYAMIWPWGNQVSATVKLFRTSLDKKG